MEINWFTLVAQVVNFLILVYLLKRFLYGPITKAMDEREQRVADRLAEAEEKRAQADEEAQLYYARRTELEEKQEDILEEADRQAEGRRKELIEGARRETEALQARWREAVEREKAAFLADLRQRAGEQICAVTTRALRDLASQDLQEQMVEAFIGRLHEMPVADREALSAAVRQSGGALIVTTAVDADPETRAQVEEAVRSVVSSRATVSFRRDADLICGIELKSEGLKLSWNIAEYMDSLRDSVAQALDEETAD